MSHSFTLAHLNVRSLTAHFNDFSEHMLSNSYDVIAIGESWLTAAVQDHMIRLPGYNLERLDRVTRRGGGVALYLTESLSYRRLPDFDYNREGLECMVVELGLGGVRACICVMYRPPNGNITSFLEDFDALLSDLNDRFECVFVMGDLNIDLCDSGSYRAFQFIDIIESHFHRQLISQPTRVAAASQTLLDVIVTNHESVLSSGVLPVPEVSDHYLVYCRLPGRRAVRTKIEKTYRDFTHFEYDPFYRDLCDLPMYNILLFDDIDSKVQFFNECLLALFDRHAPFRTATFTRPPAPWITSTVKDMMRLRDRSLLRFRGSRRPADWSSYKELRNLTNTAIRREKRAYLDHCDRTKSASDMWRSLRLCGTYKNCNNKSIPAHLNNATEINNYFVNSIDPRPVSVETEFFYNTHLLHSVQGCERFKFHHVTENT